MEGNMESRIQIVNILASNLRYLRHNTKVEEPITGKVKFMSQRQLAEFIGSATQQVSKFELGTNQLSAVQLYKVGKVFGLSVDKLFDANLIKSDYSKIIKQDIYA
jgi:transcriptional regulator with XRE-family HTH domain